MHDRTATAEMRVSERDPAPAAPELTHALAELHETRETLSRLVAVLNDKLSPVLRDLAPAGPEELLRTPRLTSYARALQDEIDDLTMTGRAVGSIIDRLEV